MPLAITPRIDGRWEVNVTNSLAPGFYDYSYSFLPFGGQPTAHATTESVTMLRSTSAPVSDFWSVRGQSYPTIGGASQLFSTQKPAFVVIPK